MVILHQLLLRQNNKIIEHHHHQTQLNFRNTCFKMSVKLTESWFTVVFLSINITLRYKSRHFGGGRCLLPIGNSVLRVFVHASLLTGDKGSFRNVHSHMIWQSSVIDTHSRNLTTHWSIAIFQKFDFPECRHGTVSESSNTLFLLVMHEVRCWLNLSDRKSHLMIIFLCNQFHVY